MRATTLAWATALAAHVPSSATPGMTPVLTQRRRVAGVTPTRRAASARVSSPAMAGKIDGRILMKWTRPPAGCTARL